MKKKKPNCYDCKYIGDIAGSAHNKCLHPSVIKVREDEHPIIGLMAIMGSGSKRFQPPPPAFVAKELNIRGNEWGIKKGWFNWPYNFDPTWLESCNGFEKNNAFDKNRL